MGITSGLGNNEDNKYILDIDLDYFHTRKSINPATSAIFYNLIRNSLAVTIAKECSCVELCRLKGETIDCAYLLDKLLKHIKKAMK